MFWLDQLVRTYKRVLDIAKTAVIDTNLFFKNSMIYNISVNLKRYKPMQLVHVYLNVF